jgi:XTP/dITP diphosphohydrolase
MRRLLADCPWEVDDLDRYPNLPVVAETGSSYRENAWLKAGEVARLTGEVTLADDSGIEVAALDWGPGLYSARWAGPGKDAAAINQQLLEALAGCAGDERRAFMRCALALAHPDGRRWFGEGSCEGEIAAAPVGADGFGYDPIFFLPVLGLTLAQLPASVRDGLSHRGKAVEELKPVLLDWR